MYVFCVLFDPRIDVIWEGVKACARGMNIPFSSYFDVHQGIKVLTHSHIWRLICNIYIYTYIETDTDVEGDRWRQVVLLGLSLSHIFRDPGCLFMCVLICLCVDFLLYALIHQLIDCVSLSKSGCDQLLVLSHCILIIVQ